MAKIKLSEILTSLNARLEALEHTVNDVLVKSLLEANDAYEYDQGLSAFREAHPEISEMDPKLKALYGEDFDAGKTLYDARPESYEEGQDEASWVADELAKANAKLDALVQVMAPAVEGEEVPATEGVEGVEGEAADAEADQTMPDEISEEQLAAELKAAKGE